jgi:ATP-dependent helicase/nuclease subunit A
VNIRIVTASAGTGKTTHLCALLRDAVATSSARPEAIVATTFTKQAAAELLNRARSELLRKGQARAAEALMTARMGTVNGVCGGIVSDFAFELGLSPELRVLDEEAADLELVRALAAVVDSASSSELDRFKDKFDKDFDWHHEVKRIIETARANGIEADQLGDCAQRSRDTLDVALGPVTENGSEVDAELLAAIGLALAGLAGSVDATKGSAKYVTFLQGCQRDLKRGRLRWGDWALLSGETLLPTKKSRPHAAGVRRVAIRHQGHPRLRAEIHALIDALFHAAKAGMAAYQGHKADLGLLDFVDQEVLALQALRRDDVRQALAGKLDLLLVDEFQDTSPLQLAIFLELAQLAKASVWVGDPKQAIYGFRGTDPSLMDAAIESLANPRDPDLIAAVVDRVAGDRPVQTLKKSFRSRPALVQLTNEIFARAFLSQGIPDERTRVDGALSEDPPELGPAFAHWVLKGKNQNDRAQALAAGLATLLETKPCVRERQSGATRPATLADLAVLCRTNVQCGAVAEALARQGLAAVVARVGLLDTAEGQVLMAGLRLWADPRDRLAAASLHRILERPEDAARFVAEVLMGQGEPTDLSQSPVIAAIIAARERSTDVDVLGAVDEVMAASDLRRLCAEWGDSLQRTANLDALRAHASSYCDGRNAGRDAPSLVGLLRHLEDMEADDKRRGKSRTDRCALQAGQDAIRVSTWHAAKGLEWPMVVLYGLEDLRGPLAHGVHVMSDGHEFDSRAPLAGRWIRFWPNAYTTFNQQGPVKTAYERSLGFDQVVLKRDREALRVLYVGWTRARDNLILAAEKGKLLGGILGVLPAFDQALISEPVVEHAEGSSCQTIDVVWAGRQTKIEARLCSAKRPPTLAPQAGCVRTGRMGSAYQPARGVPSAAEPRAFAVSETVDLGPPFHIGDQVDANVLGTTVHAFFAADSRDLKGSDREAIGAGLLERYGVAAALSSSDLMGMADRLWRWIDTRFPKNRVRKEWPLTQRLNTGTIVSGTADLVVETADHLAIVDHKSGSTWEGVMAKSGAYAAQLGSYGEALLRAGSPKPLSTWIHLPFAGRLVRLTID